MAGLLVAFAGCADKTGDRGGGPPPSTYTISGTVSGIVAANVTVQLQGSSRKAITNSLGQYSIGPVPNGTYVVEATLAGYVFTPAARAVTVSGAPVAGQDFTSAIIPPPPPPGLFISGKVTGDGPEGAALTLVGPDPATTSSTVLSQADGTYEFQPVVSGVYRLTPSRAGGWTFHPADSLVTVAGTSLTGPDFASIAPVHTLSGRITGPFTSGVVVTLSGDAGAVALTDGAGSYAFTGLPPGDYLVTPSYPGYAFGPPERAVTMGGADLGGQDFVSAATHKLAGRISGDVLLGVRVDLTGSGAVTVGTQTDASGYFEFPELVDGSYSVTPSLDGYVFGPAQRSVTLAGVDVTSADFTATLSPGVTVSGTVSAALGGPLKGVGITLQGDPTLVTTTDAAGAFRIEGVPPGNFLVIPFHDDYTFDPASRFIVVGAANVTAQNFTGTVRPTTRTIAGNVAGEATAGVTVTLVGPSPATTTRTTTTDAAGSFAFRGLANGLYLATPSLPGFAFTPSDCLVSVNGPSVMFVQFTSAFAPHSISGRVTGPVIAGVSIDLALDGNAVGATVTAADGTYSFPGLANGAYTVKPTLPGFYFSPVEAPVALSGANATGVDFVIAPAHLISGHVIGSVLLGVKVTLSGAETDETTTDATGFYAFLDRRDGGYLLEASLAGHAYAPKPLAIDLAGADVTTADFTELPTYSVSGSISGAVSANVAVELSGATLDPALVTSTNGAGAYSFTGLPNGSYMVVPSSGAATFTPASRAFRIDDANVAGQDFTSP